MLRTSVRSLSLLLLLLIVGNLDGAMLRNPNGFAQIMRGGTTFDINLGQTWLWNPHPENVDLRSRGLIAANDRRQIIALDAQQDENPAPYFWNAIFGLNPSLPIGPAQPIPPHDPKNQTRITDAGGPSQFNPAGGSGNGQTAGLRRPTTQGAVGQGVTGSGDNAIGTIAGSRVNGPGVFADSIALNDRGSVVGAAGAGTGGEDHALAGMLVGDGEALFCDGCSSISDALLSDLRSFGDRNVNDLIRSSDLLDSAAFDLAFAIDDRGIRLANAGCALDTDEACQMGNGASATQVPEPGTLSLLGAGLLCLVALRGRTRNVTGSQKRYPPARRGFLVPSRTLA